MIVTLAGHVDHGKSALVHALTGTKTDRLAEEKRRGLTLDLGFAYTTTGEQRIGFVDVPGHHRFIHNMVAGVAHQQFALLVVAADDGVMPQTREHLDILRTLALSRGCIALTKTDLVDQARITSVEAELDALTEGTFLEAAPIFPCSTLDAATLSALKKHLQAAAVNSKHDSSSDREPFRLAVDRSFTLSGAGCVVTGTVHGGEVAIGDSLRVGIAAKPVRVRGIRVQNEESNRAIEGDRAAINIAGIDHQAVNRGDWLLDEVAHNPSLNVVIDLTLLNTGPNNGGLKNWGRVHVHAATSHRVGRVALLANTSTESQLAELVLDEPLQAKHGDRIVLRDYARQATLGGGAVVFAGQTPPRRRHPDHLAMLESYQAESPAATLKQLLSAGPTAIADWRRTYLLSDEAADKIIASATAMKLANQPELSVLKTDYAQSLEDVLAAVTGASKAAEPASTEASQGITLKELCAETGWSMPMVRAAATELTQKQKLQNLRGRYQLPRVANQLSDSLQTLLDKCTPLIDAPHPASVGDLSKSLNVPLGTLTKALTQISKARALVRIGDKRYALPKQMQGWADITEDLSTTAPFGVKQFRDRSGLGRNMSIDVLEFMDSKGYTRRNGDTRTVVGDRATLR